MTDWSQPSDAGGTAEYVQALLDQAVPAPGGPVWSELWSQLCDQGTVYPASFAALPALTRQAHKWLPAQRAAPLVLAGAILCSTDRLGYDGDPHVEYAAEIAELIALTDEALRDPGLVDDPRTYIDLLEALLGFDGVQILGAQLDGFNHGEYEVPCPQCEADNFIVFGEYGYFSTFDAMYMNETGSTRKRKPLLPADPAALEGLAQRLHTRALADGHPGIANKLTYAFGSAHCVECDAIFRVDLAVVARWGT